VATASANGTLDAHTNGLNCFVDGNSQTGFTGGSSYGLGAALFDKALSAAEAAGLISPHWQWMTRTDSGVMVQCQLLALLTT
jgi:hypothetical protein